MHVKPKAGLVVRDPKTKFPLPPEGREVQPTSYWQRRLAAGDVVPVEVKAPVALVPVIAPSWTGTDEETEP